MTRLETCARIGMVVVKECATFGDPKDRVFWWGYGTGLAYCAWYCTEESIELIIDKIRLARVITTKPGKCVKLSWRWGDTRETK